MRPYKTYILSLFTVLFSILANAQNCNLPFGISFSNVSTNSITVRWTDSNPNPTGWEIEITPRNGIRTGIPTHTNISSRQITINDLTPSTAYDLSIRTVCNNGQRSGWNTAIPFTTRLEVPTACGINIPLKDDGTEILSLNVPQSGILGKDVFIKNIQLIIDHTWPADLNIVLETPQRQRITLSNHNGTGAHHFGNPNDAFCTSVTQFSQEACSILRNERPPFIGNYKPDTNINNLKLDTLTKGDWRLIIFDRALKDVGFLKYFHIEFTNDLCTVPKNFTIEESNVNSIAVSWERDVLCHTAKLVIYENNIGLDTIFVSCNQRGYLFNNLKPNSTYTFSINGLCLPNEESVQSCLIEGQTTCESISVAEDFDSLPICPNDCGGTCDLLEGIWFNISDDGPQNWLVNQNSTGTALTGPLGDINSKGRYVYIGSNPTVCGAKNEVTLQSVCMDVKSNPSGCDMSYYYHMYGFDVQSLTLEISIDNGASWVQLTRHEGNQGDQWYRNTISLKDYDEMSAIFRFVGISGSGILGQIALDQIEFYKSLQTDVLYTYYKDHDGDGYGIESDILRICQNFPPDGYSRISGDCDDDNPNIYPGAEEVLCNGIDENCNGMEDDQPQENPLNIEPDLIQPLCNGSKDGQINLNISGGEGPYISVWNNGSIGEKISGISEGVYYAQIIDNLGCIFKTPFIVLNPQNILVASITEIVDPTCDGFADGILTVSHSVGTAPYSYTWSNGSTDKTNSGLKSGSYSVTVTDYSGCFTIVEGINLNSTPKIQVAISSKRDPFCAGQKNGLIELITSGGQPPYSYLWNTGDTSAMIQSLGAGTYTCSISDSDGCQNIFTTIFREPSPMEIQLVDAVNPRCFGERNGLIKTHASGGQPPYTYFWNRHSVFTDDIFGLGAGEYVLTVTDRNGCNAVLDTVFIKNPEKISITIDSITPSSCISGRTGSIQVTAIGGNDGFNFAWLNFNNNASTLDSLISGNYSLTVFDKLGCKESIPNIFVPSENIPVEVQLTLVSDNLCYNDKKGIITNDITTGSPPFDYNWSAGHQYFSESRGDSLINLPKGQYQLTITDGLGCVGISNTVTLTEGKRISYQILELTPNICQNDSEGTVKLKVNGGQLPYNVIWNNGLLEGDSITHLPSGIYQGIITDALGCMEIINGIHLFSISNIHLNAQTIDILNDTKGSICIFPTQGQPPYSIVWSSGTINQNCIEIEQPGQYSVTVTDALNCEKVDSFIIEKISNITEQEEKILPARVYPNPFSEILVIESSTQTIQNISVYDPLGRFVYGAHINDNSYHLDMSEHSNGVYFVVIQFKDKTNTFKVIKL